jgi:hypothetical protein
MVNIYNIINGKQIKSFDMTELLHRDKSMSYRFILRYGCLNIASNLVCYNIVEDGRRNQSFSRLLIISIGDDANILWSREMALLSKTAYLQVKDCMIYIIDLGSIVVLDPSSGKILHQLEEADSDFKIKPDNTIVAQKKIIWQSGHLQSAFRKFKNVFIIAGDRVKNISDPTCLAKDYLDGYVYLEEFYPVKLIRLAPACQSKPFVGGTVWHFFPSKDGFPSNPQIVHVDHHFILIKAGYHYWAVGEDAVVDYLRRADSLRKNQ